MFVGFQHPRFDSLAKLWNECLPPAYRINETLLEQNTVEAPAFDWGASVIEIDDDAKPLGFVSVKHSAAKLFNGPDPDLAHISAVVCPSPKSGVDMLSYVKSNLRNRGIYRLTFGQDVRHFFPGCPVDLIGMKDLLTVEGFTLGKEYWDLRHNLREFQPLESAMARITAGPEKVVIEKLHYEEVPRLERFLRREFPGRWTYDTLSKVKVEGRSDYIYVLKVNGEIEGFAITQDASHKLPIAGAVFHEGIGADWCTLGPIGVSYGIRGKGLGDALLASALNALKESGKGTCTIDWTTLKDWYGKHGFQICRTYVPFTLRLDESI